MLAVVNKTSDLDSGGCCVCSVSKIDGSIGSFWNGKYIYIGISLYFLGYTFVSYFF